MMLSSEHGRCGNGWASPAPLESHLPVDTPRTQRRRMIEFFSTRNGCGNQLQSDSSVTTSTTTSSLGPNNSMHSATAALTCLGGSPWPSHTRGSSPHVSRSCNNRSVSADEAAELVSPMHSSTSARCGSSPGTGMISFAAVTPPDVPLPIPRAHDAHHYHHALSDAAPVRGGGLSFDEPSSDSSSIVPVVSLFSTAPQQPQPQQQPPQQPQQQPPFVAVVGTQTTSARAHHHVMTAFVDDGFESTSRASSLAMTADPFAMLDKSSTMLSSGKHSLFLLFHEQREEERRLEAQRRAHARGVLSASSDTFGGGGSRLATEGFFPDMAAPFTTSNNASLSPTNQSSQSRHAHRNRFQQMKRPSMDVGDLFDNDDGDDDN